MYEIPGQYVEKLQRKVRKTKFKQRAETYVKVGQTQQKWKILCQDKSIYQISDDWEKSGKPSGRTDWQTARKPIVPPPPPRGFIGVGTNKMYHSFYILNYVS